MEHSQKFLAIVNEVREKISEVSVDQARERLKAGKHVALVDVREDREWDKQHACEAVHLGKGVLERDIENMFPDKSTELIMYCGGGYRSALTAEVAQRMGYKNIHSLAGGYKALLEAEWPMNKSGTGK
ncbi:rhodanese-like domain-containing protein [Verrucomicrobia bacterium]|nr:rhodanese-like domain-containing protein [Verrucomicrobiota bacterium]